MSGIQAVICKLVFKNKIPIFHYGILMIILLCLLLLKIDNYFLTYKGICKTLEP